MPQMWKWRNATVASALRFPRRLETIRDTIIALKVAFEGVLFLFIAFGKAFEAIHLNNPKTLDTMKLNVMLMIAVAGVFGACNSQTSKTDSDSALDRFESYVDSVENELSADARHDWAEIESEYKKRKVDAEDALQEATGEERTELDKLESRYKKAKADAEKKWDQFGAKSEKHLKRAEGWLEQTMGNVEEKSADAAEQTEESLRESIDWLEQNYEKLEDGAKEQYESLKSRLSESEKS